MSDADRPSREALRELRRARTRMRMRLRAARSVNERDMCRHWISRLQTAIDSEERALFSERRAR